MGSSEYLAMGAIVVRRVNLPHVMQMFDEARAERRKPDGAKFKKFSKSNSKDNFVLTQALGSKPVKVAVIGFHKPSLENTYVRQNHGNEYNYLFKFLIERISWIVRDADSAGGDHSTDIILSRQEMYSFDELRGYTEKLKRGRGRFNTRTNWENIGNIDQTPHQNETEMHLADLVASSFHLAIEPKDHGMTDERFFMNLSKRIYRGREGKPHGLKLWPNEAIEPAKSAGRLLFLDRL